MKPSDFDEFHAMLSECLSMWSGPPSAGITATWFRTLAGYDLPTLSAAFTGHMRDPVNGKFQPLPGHIIEQIERAAKNDGRPGVEEAWAISLAARDERDTVVWTNECAQAWGMAAPVMDIGDEVGARMAFKEAYARLVAEARARREPASWEMSEGFDKDRRRAAILHAIEAGRIPAGRYPAVEYAVPLLLGSSATVGMPEEVRQRLADLREQFSRRAEAPSEADEDRQLTKFLKRTSLEKVEQYARGVR